VETSELLDQFTAEGIAVAIDVALFACAELREAFPDCTPIGKHGAAMEADGWCVPICPCHEGVRAHHLRSRSCSSTASATPMPVDDRTILIHTPGAGNNARRATASLTM
jgi:hypothetical protein